MDLQAIKKCPLFEVIGESDLKPLLDCLSAVRKSYLRDEFIFRSDEPAEYVGIVLSGGALVIQEDFWGNRSILAHIAPGGLFGEALACAGVEKMPVSVLSADKSEILLIRLKKIITVCGTPCQYHSDLVMNLLRVLAQKNLTLTRKMAILSRRTTREKLLALLSGQAMNEKSGVIEIPFGRQELADYLCVDRSALSRELSAMSREGLLKFDKNRFELSDGHDGREV